MSEDEARKRLGRGLAALIGDLDRQSPANDGPKLVSSDTGAARPDRMPAERMVPIEKIRANPNNPRRMFADHELQDLATSIAKHGVVQPILVRSAAGDDLGGAEYEIIAGERRWRAAQRASLHEIPIIIRNVGDNQALELAIIENVQRADLNVIEEASGYQQLIDDYDYSQADLGKVIGKSRSHVANTLRLLKLPDGVRELVMEGSLSAGHARTLVTAENPLALAQRIVSEGLSVRQAEALAQESLEGESATSQKAEKLPKPADIVSFEKRIEDVLGLKVDLRHKQTGKGEIRIKYSSLDQLDELERRLGKAF